MSKCCHLNITKLCKYKYWDPRSCSVIRECHLHLRSSDNFGQDMLQVCHRKYLECNDGSTQSEDRVAKLTMDLRYGERGKNCTCKLDKQMSTDAEALTEQLGFSVTVTSAVGMTRCRGCVWVCVYVAIFVLYCVTLATTHQHTAPPCKYDAGNRQHGKQWQVAPCYHPIWSPHHHTPHLSLCLACVATWHTCHQRRILSTYYLE